MHLLISCETATGELQPENIDHKPDVIFLIPFDGIEKMHEWN
jgi:hypothetical protein